MTQVLTETVTGAPPGGEGVAAASSALSDILNSDPTTYTGKSAQAQAAEAEVAAETTTTTETAATTTEGTEADGGKANATPAQPSAEPVKLTTRQQRGAKYTSLTEEQLAQVTPEQVKMLDDLGMMYDRACGKVGQAAKEARKAAAAVAKPAEPAEASSSATGADDEGGGAAPGTEVSPASTDDDPFNFKPEDISDESGFIDSGKMAERFGRIANAFKSERENHVALQGTVSEMHEVMEQLVAELFFSTINQETYGHFGKGPTYALPKDSEALAFRTKLTAAAHDNALGAAFGEGKPISFLEAMQRMVDLTGADTIRKAERDRIAKSRVVAQAGALHEPGGTSKPAPNEVTIALARLKKTLDKSY